MSLVLQTCRDCGALQYPSRDACRICLSDALERRMTVLSGTVASEATIHRSLDPQGLVDGPLRIGTIATTRGVRFVALLGAGVVTGMEVDLQSCPDRPGAIVAVALPDDADQRKGPGPC